MREIVKENIAKNILLIVLLALVYMQMPGWIENNGSLKEAEGGDMLLVVSFIAVIACFGCFAFTYGDVNIKKAWQRYLAHLTTGLLMLIIGVSLILTSIIASGMVGSFAVFDVLLLLLYVSCICYDFWDLLRVGKAK